MQRIHWLLQLLSMSMPRKYDEDEVVHLLQDPKDHEIPPNFPPLSKKGAVGWCMLGALTIVAVAERCLFKIVVDRLENYRFLLGELNVLLFIPLLWATMLYQNRFCKETVLEEPKKTKFTDAKMLFISLLDILQLFMMWIPASRISGQLTVVLLQMNVPLFALSSYLIHGTRFERTQVIGALLIACGILANLLPLFFRQVDSVEAWNSLMYLLCALPALGSALIKEAVLRDEPTDMTRLNARLASWQAVLGLFLCPLAYKLQGLGLGWSWMDMHDFGRSISDGMQCIVTGVAPPVMGLEYGSSACEGSGSLLVVAVVAMMGLNLLLPAVMETVSVTAAYAVLTVAVPLSALSITLLTYRSEALVIFSISDIIALPLVTAGLYLHRSQPQPHGDMNTTHVDDAVKKVTQPSYQGDPEYGNAAPWKWQQN